LCIGIMVASFQHEGKVWEDQDQLKMAGPKLRRGAEGPKSSLAAILLPGVF